MPANLIITLFFCSPGSKEIVRSHGPQLGLAESGIREATGAQSERVEMLALDHARLGYGYIYK